jgi:hypothetical protein
MGCSRAFVVSSYSAQKEYFVAEMVPGKPVDTVEQTVFDEFEIHSLSEFAAILGLSLAQRTARADTLKAKGHRNDNVVSVFALRPAFPLRAVRHVFYFAAQ